MSRTLPALLVANALLLAAPPAGAQQAPPAVPAPPAAAPAPQHRSVTLMVTGIVFAGVGAAMLASGGVGVAVGCQKTVCAEGGGFILPAIALWTIGAAHVIAGVPMIVVGALPPKQPAAATGPGVAPSAAPAPRTFGLGWTF